ncbi:unnamed protein product [Thelazia callipaeda]|uniref:Uncharacterized protein n=1 Tax=Thelazia callipaeda TaxID=103827 RepID=A0A0N5D6B7_THECL|nr:unnamed protein product [Thelazia callipaeda]
MQSPQRLYPGLNTITSAATVSRYSPIETGATATAAAAAYRTRMPSNFQTNSIFGTFDDTLFQARAAQAALAEIDVKNVNMAASGMLRPTDMFT